MDIKQARHYLEAVVARHTAKLDRQRAVALSRSKPKAVQKCGVDGKVDETPAASPHPTSVVDTKVRDTEAADDKAASVAYLILADRGLSGQLEPEDIDQLRQEGFSDDVADLARYMLETYRDRFWSDAERLRLKADLRQTIGLLDPASGDVDQARQIKLRAMGIACGASSQRRDGKLTQSDLDLVERLQRDGGASPSSAISAAPLADLGTNQTSDQAGAPARIESTDASANRPKEMVEGHWTETASAPGNGIVGSCTLSNASGDPEHRLSSIAARLIAVKARTGIEDKTLRQIDQVAQLLIEVVGDLEIGHLRQSHLARFVEVMDALPPVYTKSAAEKAMPIAEILQQAQSLPTEKRGLSVATINRNLTFVGQLIAKAEDDGLVVDAKLKPARLKRKRSKRVRDERPAFSYTELRSIFSQPLWQGCQSPRRRLVAGETIIKDGLYWVPLIAAYSGARREEISALKIDDLEWYRLEDGQGTAIVQGSLAHPFDEGAGVLASSGPHGNRSFKSTVVPVLNIRPNSNRRLKNLQSERLVPLHPHLIELGFIEYAQGVRNDGNLDLFPELKPHSEKTLFGDAIYDGWTNAVKTALGDAADGKVFHSLRHYVVGTLKQMPSVTRQCEEDIVGHAGEGESGERYGGVTPLAAKYDAIAQLPRVF